MWLLLLLPLPFNLLLTLPLNQLLVWMLQWVCRHDVIVALHIGEPPTIT